MKKELTRAELIEIGKKNEKPYGLMVKEYPQLEEIFEKLKNENKIELFIGYKWTKKEDSSLINKTTYRINPDYTEKPKGIDLIYCDAFVEDNRFIYKINQDSYLIESAITRGAIGFMFEGSDSIYNSPIMYQDDEGHLSPNWFEDEILSGEVTPVRANKVVFIK